MGDQNYVGQYFINNVNQDGLCVQDVGECVWQDREKLLCANYLNCTSRSEFNSILLIPISLAKKINWYATLDEFYEGNFAYSNASHEMTMTSEERDNFLSITVLPDFHSDFPWWRHFGLTGNCVARLVRCFKEYPDSGEILAHSISAKAAKQKSRKATIEAITKMIVDEGLSTDEIIQLSQVTQFEHEWLFHH